MEIPYLVRNLPKGYTSGRKEFAAKYADKLSSFRKSAGFVMVPLLVDPNTGMGSTKNMKYNMLRGILTVCHLHGIVLAWTATKYTSVN